MEASGMQERNIGLSKSQESCIVTSMLFFIILVTFKVTHQNRSQTPFLIKTLQSVGIEGNIPQRLKSHLRKAHSKYHSQWGSTGSLSPMIRNKIFYLSIPPSVSPLPQAKLMWRFTLIYLWIQSSWDLHPFLFHTILRECFVFLKHT